MCCTPNPFDVVVQSGRSIPNFNRPSNFIKHINFPKLDKLTQLTVDWNGNRERGSISEQDLLSSVSYPFEEQTAAEGCFSAPFLKLDTKVSYFFAMKTIDYKSIQYFLKWFIGSQSDIK